MLSAQKEQIRLASGTSEDLPNVSSFGKVVNSIQGLQERLDNFSADDIGIAHDKTQTLLSRLADLQKKLTAYVAINTLMTAVRESVDQTVTEFHDRARLESAEAPLQIQTLIQTNKLIQFPRLHRLLATPSLLDSKISAPAISLTADDERCEIAVSENSMANLVRTPSQNSDLEESGIAAPPPDENVFTVFSQEQNTPDSPPPSLLEDKTETIGRDFDVAPKVVPPPTTEAKPDSDDLCAREHTASVTPVEAVPDDNVIEPPAANKITGFDQRLLDDLIKNYGEFAAGFGPSRTTEGENAVTTDSATIVQSDPPQPEEAVPERNLPSIKKQGDIDRQLKKIIKDYGEYDLYSRQGPVNFKTGVIAAFVLLGLVLSGFYYFSPSGSQNSATSSPAPIHSSSTTESKDRQNVANQPGAVASETGTLRGANTNSQSKK